MQTVDTAEEKGKGQRNPFTRVGSQLAALLGLVLICIVLSILSPHFPTLSNFFNISRQAAVITIIAIGETFVILTGGIDLSVGSVVTLTSCTMALVMITQGSIFLGVAAAIAVGLLVGAINGALVTRAKLPPFIVTLVLEAMWGKGQPSGGARPAQREDRRGRAAAGKGDDGREGEGEGDGEGQD